MTGYDVMSYPVMLCETLCQLISFWDLWQTCLTMAETNTIFKFSFVEEVLNCYGRLFIHLVRESICQSAWLQHQFCLLFLRIPVPQFGTEILVTLIYWADSHTDISLIRIIAKHFSRLPFSTCVLHYSCHSFLWMWGIYCLICYMVINNVNCACLPAL
jgi:hypothetical protein